MEAHVTSKKDPKLTLHVGAPKVLPMLPNKRADEVIVAEIKKLVNQLTGLMNEADAAGINVVFGINRPAPGVKFIPELTITKAL